VIEAFFKNRSLRSITLVGGLMCAILPALILAAGSIFAIQSWTFREELSRAHAHAQTLADLFQQELSAQLRAVETVGNAGRLLPSVTTDSMAPVLQEFMTDRPMIDRISMTDANGIIIAANPARNPDGTTSIGNNLTDRKYFQEVMAKKQGEVSREALIGKTSGKLVIVIAAPRYDSAGQIAGIVFATMGADDLSAVIGKFKYGTSGHAGVTTEAGIVIGFENPDLVNKRADFSKEPIWNYMGSQDEGEIAGYTDERGYDRVGGFATVPIVGWKVWVSRTVREIDGLILDSYAYDIIWVGLAIALAAGATIMLARQITRPVEAVRMTAVKIANGELGARTPDEGPIEVAELARSINKMADTLQGSLEKERDGLQKLQQTVQEYAGLAARVASGDLTARVSEADDGNMRELGSGLNRMTGSLSQLVREIRGAVKSVASASAEILAATSQQVSATAEEATAVRQTAATVAEVRQTAEAAARRTRNVAEMRNAWRRRRKTAGNPSRRAFSAAMPPGNAWKPWPSGS
jgi:HAMP domain-containing protein